jgi:hypothetical protein
VNDAIWSMYFNNLLPLLAKNGSDDGNYVVTVDSDLACLQVSKQCSTCVFITRAQCGTRHDFSLKL